MPLRISIELMLDSSVDDTALAQGIYWLTKASSKPPAVSKREVPAWTPPQPLQEMPSPEEMAADAADAEMQQEYIEEQEAAASDDIVAQYKAAETLVNATAAPRRRGRRSNAEKAAEKAAATAEQMQPPAQSTAPTPVPFPPLSGTAQPFAGPVPGYTPPPFPGATQGEFVMPPGYTPPPFGTSAPQPQTPAMPPVGTSPAPTNGAAMPLDEFRAAVSKSNEAKSGVWFRVIRSRQWADGTPKDSWLSVDAVPEGMRIRALAEFKIAEAQA